MSSTPLFFGNQNQTDQWSYFKDMIETPPNACSQELAIDDFLDSLNVFKINVELYKKDLNSIKKSDKIMDAIVRQNSFMNVNDGADLSVHSKSPSFLMRRRQNQQSQKQSNTQFDLKLHGALSAVPLNNSRKNLLDFSNA
jgi:hypothetical protein